MKVYPHYSQTSSQSLLTQPPYIIIIIQVGSHVGSQRASESRPEITRKAETWSRKSNISFLRPSTWSALIGSCGRAGIIYMTGISLRSQAGAMEPYHTGIVQSASGFHSVQRAAGHLAVDLLLLLLRCQVGSVHVFCCCRWCLCFLGFFFFFFYRHVCRSVRECSCRRSYKFCGWWFVERRKKSGRKTKRLYVLLFQFYYFVLFFPMHTALCFCY